MPGGGGAIICSSGSRKKCVGCGRRADLACDWKVETRRSGTCDKPICSRCTVSPAPEKDLCPAHAQAFDAWKLARTETHRQEKPN